AHTEYISGYPGVTETDAEDVLSFLADISFNGGVMTGYMILADVSRVRTMNPPTLQEGEHPRADDEICLPYIFKTGGGFKLGDTVAFVTGGETLNYRVAGFTEEIMYGSLQNGQLLAYLSPEGFKELSERLPGAECVLLSARLTDPEDGEKLYLDSFREFFYNTAIPGADHAYFRPLAFSDARMVRTMMSDITSVIMVMFAALITVVCLIVVRFRIRNSIEEGITNLGALKAVGYTGAQLAVAVAAQFGGLALVGAVSGVALSYAALPAASRVLEQQTAMQWRQGFDAPISFLTAAVIVSAALAVSLATARRIRRLQPLAALRQGLSVRNFKRSNFPLDKSRGPLAWLLALKSAFQNRGQTAMLFIITAAVSFVAAAGTVMYYSIGINPDDFGRLLAGETPNAAFFIKTPDDAETVMDFIRTREDVRKAFYYQDCAVLIGDDIRCGGIVVDDFSNLEGVLLYDGRYPNREDEIALSGKIAGLTGTAVGDSIDVTQSGRTARYLVVGFIQSVNEGGLVCAMSGDGFRRIQPDYRPVGIYVYMNDPDGTAAFIDSVSGRYGAVFDSVANLDVLIDTQLGMFSGIFKAVSVAIIAVTALVVVLTLYLMLKTAVLRSGRQLGIQKALGFTTLQLMNQTALYFLPSAAVGVILGGAAGSRCFAPIFVILTKSMGIMTASLQAPAAPIVVLCAALTLLVYAASMLIARRIRKISAYALVCE
ncbi:MAG: FtsX-like permease family protein, partial [Oscillospiraceae bacterium]|nr:FtsX-like permease family protein [Oscillospiraceae bacterium]